MRSEMFSDYFAANYMASDDAGYGDSSNVADSNHVTDVIFGGATTDAPEVGSDNATTTALQQFSFWYQGVHGYVSVACCLFGIVSNAMNILVLTRRSMISPTNHLLTALAIADLLTMISYLPYAVYFYCITVPDEQYGHSMGWVIYLLFNTYFTITTHTAAMWLTVALAVFRYIVVCCQQSVGVRMCSLRRAKITIAAVFIATPIFCIPHYVKHRLQRRTADRVVADGGTAAATSWKVDYDEYDVLTLQSTSAYGRSAVDSTDMGYWFAETDFLTSTMNNINYWLFGVVMKVVPCILLAVLSWLLFRAMREAAEKRRRLLSAGRRDESERAGEHVRTTAMLVAVVLCFIATELPQGVLALLSGVNNGVFTNVYVPLADVFDVLVLVNSAVNFVLYCTMSRQFRLTFGELFIDTTCIGRLNKASKSQTTSGCRANVSSSSPAVRRTTGIDAPATKDGSKDPDVVRRGFPAA